MRIDDERLSYEITMALMWRSIFWRDNFEFLAWILADEYPNQDQPFCIGPAFHDFH